MKISLTTLIFAAIFSFTLNAQNSISSAGIHWNDNAGISVEIQRAALYKNLFFLHGSERSFSFSALKEFDYKSVKTSFAEMKLLYGYGLTVGWESELYRRDTEYWNQRRSPFFGHGGLCAYGGIEYEFPSFPLAIRLDVNPSLELSTATLFRLRVLNMGFGIKFNFSRT